jgi:hypothetical protein
MSKTISQKLDIVLTQYSKKFGEIPDIFGIDEFLLYERIKNSLQSGKPVKPIVDSIKDEQEIDGDSENIII